MNKTIWIYGASIAAVAILLLTTKYFFAVELIPSPVYIAIIAILFTALGIWLGKKVSGQEGRKSRKIGFIRNEYVIKSLRISERELEVLKQLGLGRSNQEIANELHLSINDVKTDVSNLFQKLEVNRRSLAVKKGRSLNLIP